MNSVRAFQNEAWGYYAKHGRDLPWRRPEHDGSFDPYKIMVSEIMLQQTQVARVVPKYQEFLNVFPNIDVLAQATFADVLKHWNGLGYNRRAKFLLEAAKTLNKMDAFPDDPNELEKLPGIGKNTAAAICVYAYDQRHIFIETNIRTVCIHHLFSDQTDISDKQIVPWVEQALPDENYREWYWALMDYGSYLKQTISNISKRSKHYTKQSRFEGSTRQLRAAVLRSLLGGDKSMADLQSIHADERLKSVIASLRRDELIHEKNGKFGLN